LKPDGVLRAEIEHLDLGEIRTYPLNSFYDRNTIVQLRRFVHHLRSSKIDLLQTHDFYTNIFGMVAGFLAGTAVRVASRRDITGIRNAAQRQAQKVTYALAHQIVANSESVRRKLMEEGVSRKRITVIHNGLDFERVTAPVSVSHEATFRALGFPEVAAVPKRFVTIVANMRHEVKDYPMFLRAAERISHVAPDVGFLLAGDGELRESIEAMAAKLGIAGKTFFLGGCENIAKLLNISDVCVLSSKAEGFSNSILEYMAARRPVVATDVGGAREAIIEGQTGYLVPSGNDQNMAERIVSLLADPKKARQMGEKGRRIVEEKFSASALLQKAEALYEKLLAGKVRTGSVSVIRTAGASPPSRSRAYWS
jgi:glycosyltransferase involved in cell wall biosynthesis